nr:hypothetical protein G8766_10660 [Lactococcus garvieae]UKS69653.1 hypothetical protein G8766_10800 [Lactococcus garvieae]UKS69670.1 hypothetical protein G8766_10945 [Lactococcus garvieae]
MEHHKNHQMTHDTSGKLPEGIKTAQHPKYPLGTKVILGSVAKSETQKHYL